MANQALVDYVKQQLQRNVNRDEIKQILLAKGWPAEDVEAAFNSLGHINQIVIPVKPAPQLSYPTVTEKNNKKLLVIIGSAVVVMLLLIGAGALAYNYYFPAPEKVLQKMFASLASVKSLEYSGEIKAEIKIKPCSNCAYLTSGETPSSGKINNVSIDFNGSSEIKKDPNGVLAVNLKTDALPTGDATLGLEMRTINKIIYLSLTQVPNLGLMDLSSFKNQWVKIDTEALKKQLGDNLGKQIEEYQAKGNLSQDKLAKIEAVWQKFKIIKITEKLKNEKINGLDTYHYKFEIDPTELKPALIEAITIIQDKPLAGKELADFSKSFDETIAKSKSALESYNSEIWIGKKDFLPYKIYSDSVVKTSSELAYSGKSSLTLNFKNFNQPVKVDTPKAKPVDQVLGEIFTKYQTSTAGLDGETTVNNEIDTDKDGLADQYETIYGTDINKVDTDGDGFNDYEEISKGYNPNGQGKLPKGMPALDDLLPKNESKLGQSDFQLNKNIVSQSDLQLNKNTASQRDAQRLADIKQMKSALELYFNDVGRYPPAKDVKPGKPISYKGTIYLSKVPSNPTPTNDGACPADTDYVYNVQNDKDVTSYWLDFCLGAAVGNSPAGKHHEGSGKSPNIKNK